MKTEITNRDLMFNCHPDMLRKLENLRVAMGHEHYGQTVGHLIALGTTIRRLVVRGFDNIRMLNKATGKFADIDNDAEILKQ